MVGVGRGLDHYKFWFREDLPRVETDQTRRGGVWNGVCWGDTWGYSDVPTTAVPAGSV